VPLPAKCRRLRRAVMRSLVFKPQPWQLVLLKVFFWPDNPRLYLLYLSEHVSKDSSRRLTPALVLFFYAQT
jgi:hypothetical protein